MCKEHLRLEKVVVEEERSELYNQAKLLEERINKEKEWLDIKTMHKLDSKKNEISDMSDKSFEEDDSNDLSQLTIK